MDIFTFLQIVIALIFIYFIVSLIVSELQEQLAALFQWRARNLKKAIEIFAGLNITNQLYNHGEYKKEGSQASLLSGFNQYTNSWSFPGWKWLDWLRLGFGPSYIEGKIFATSLMSIIQNELSEKGEPLSSQQLLFPVAGKTIIDILKSLNPPETTVNLPETTVNLPETTVNSPETTSVVLWDRLEEVAYTTKLKYDNPTIKDFANEVAITFDELMERTSGVYKRNAKGVSLLLGLIFAFVFNIDTLHIINKLYQDPELRQGLDDLATDISDEYANCLGEADSTDQESIKNCQKKIEDKTKVIKSSLEKNQTLPIGWHSKINDKEQILNKQGGYVNAGLGWFISAIAISMGAPFWFDLLSKVMNVRNTVRPLSGSNMASSPPSSGNSKPFQSSGINNDGSVG